MTPREGVEPVAWGVRRGSDGAIVSALMSHANAIRGAEEIAGVDLEDAYTAVPLYAHPAAASAESIRAEVIEECARVCEKYATVSRMAAEAAIGKSVIVCLRDHEAASTECAAMIRALPRANKEV